MIASNEGQRLIPSDFSGQIETHIHACHRAISQLADSGSQSRTVGLSVGEDCVQLAVLIQPIGPSRARASRAVAECLLRSCPLIFHLVTNGCGLVSFDP